MECPNGDLLAAWFHGSGERSANDVEVQGARLKKGADTWSPVFVMADTPDIPDCNPVLFIDKQERLWLFWAVVHNNRWEQSILKYRRADSYEDDGPPKWDWQDIILLKPGEQFAQGVKAGFDALHYDQSMWAEYAPEYTTMLEEAAKDPLKRGVGWMTRTNPIALPSGRILLPLYSDGFNISLVAFSDDNGATWHASKPIVGLGNCQPALLRKKDGTIVAYMRDNGVRPPRIMKATSADSGASWSIAHDTDIPNPGSSVAAIALADGRWVMAFNDTNQGRRQLAIALSADEGATWPWKRYLDKAAPGQGSYSYPSLFEGHDGQIHVTYSYSVAGGQSIKHVSLDPDWIKGN